jgi:hypothetical protein
MRRRSRHTPQRAAWRRTQDHDRKNETPPQQTPEGGGHPAARRCTSRRPRNPVPPKTTTVVIIPPASPPTAMTRRTSRGGSHPASHGQWGGYRTTKALAWVLCVAPGQWLARCSDQCCGPSSFQDAKAAACAMVKGAVGDYCVSHPIAHLNGLQALLSDKSEFCSKLPDPVAH